MRGSCEPVLRRTGTYAAPSITSAWRGCATQSLSLIHIFLGGSAHHRVKKISANAISADWIAQLLRARSLARKYILACVDEILRCAPRVVGITSMFETHTAALAFASALKDRAPDIFVVLGLSLIHI